MTFKRQRGQGMKGKGSGRGSVKGGAEGVPFSCQCQGRPSRTSVPCPQGRVRTQGRADPWLCCEGDEVWFWSDLVFNALSSPFRDLLPPAPALSWPGARWPKLPLNVPPRPAPSESPVPTPPSSGLRLSPRAAGKQSKRTET